MRAKLNLGCRRATVSVTWKIIKNVFPKINPKTGFNMTSFTPNISQYIKYLMYYLSSLVPITYKAKYPGIKTHPIPITIGDISITKETRIKNPETIKAKIEGLRLVLYLIHLNALISSNLFSYK